MVRTGAEKKRERKRKVGVRWELVGSSCDVEVCEMNYRVDLSSTAAMPTLGEEEARMETTGVRSESGFVCCRPSSSRFGRKCERLVGRDTEGPEERGGICT
jgi:hypothetical protein